jgi:hypothetical protein
MSLSVVCDSCKAPGRIRHYRVAPEGWFYLIASDPEDAPEDAIIMLACSKECALMLWQPGPGPKLEDLIKARKLQAEIDKARQEREEP